MARSEARLFASIWRDPDFIALSAGAQRMYMFLTSQPDMPHCGVVRIRAAYWSTRAAGLTEHDITEALAELEERRFVVCDPTTQELLVRALLRRDRVWRQPNTFKAAAKEAHAVDSPVIRRALLAELDRIEPLLAELSGEPTRNGHPPARQVAADVLADMRATLAEGLSEPIPDAIAEPIPVPIRDALPMGTGMGSRGDAGCPPARVAPIPDPRTPVQPSAADAAAPAALTAVPDPPEPTLTQRSKAITDAYAEAEPMCRWPAVNAITLKAIKAGRWADVEIRDALLRMAREGRPVTVDSLRIELDGLPASRAAPPLSRNQQVLHQAAAWALQETS